MKHWIFIGFLLDFYWIFIGFLLMPFFAYAQALPNATAAQKNVTVVYDNATGNALMVVVDANDLTDPAWNPPNSKQVPIPSATYNSMATSDLQTFILNNAPAPVSTGL